MDIARTALNKVTGIGSKILALFIKSKQQQQIDAAKNNERKKLVHTEAVKKLRAITDDERIIKSKYDNAKQKLDNLREQEKQAWQNFQTAIDIIQLNIKQEPRQQLAILRKQERQQRLYVHSVETKKHAELETKFKAISTDELFQTAFQKLIALREEYKNLLRKLELEHQHLQQNLPDIQLYKFLANKLLKDNSISGIGTNRQSILATHGIETAADIEESKISGIKGFGKQLTNILLNWRKSMEQEFVFDPTQGIDPADTAAINQRFSSQLKLIEDQLLSGPEQLDKIKTQILQQRPQLLNELKQATLKVAQAEADLSVVSL